jgi:hypothetical protein
MSIKRILRSIICLFIWAFVFGCIAINGESFKAETVYGSGTVISEEREVPIFDQIALKGSGKVILSRALKQSVRIRTDDNLMPYIQTKVENGKLVISHERKNIKPTVLTFHVAASNLEGVSISGSGNISGNEEFISNSFYADIAGSGDIAMKVIARHLKSNISGSGSIFLSGSANFYDSNITGSGNVDAFDLQTREASVAITGSGNCRIGVSDILRAKITGSGDVLYKGYPQISQSITGSGKVKEKVK